MRPTALTIAAILASLTATIVLAQDDSIEAPIVASREDTSPQALEAERRALILARRQSEAARAKGERLEADAAAAANAADKAGRQAAALAARIQESEADIQAAEARVAIVAQLQREQAIRLAARQQPIVRLTGALQSLSRRPTIATLVQPGSVTDIVHLRSVLDTMLPVVAQRTAGLRAELARSRQLRANAETAAKALRDSRTQLASRQNDLRNLEMRQRQASRQYADTAAQESQRAIAMGETARDIVDLMDRLRVASDVRDRLAALPGPTMRPAQPGAAPLPIAQIAQRASGPPAYRLPVIGDIVSGLGEVSASGVRARGLTIRTRPLAQAVAPTAGRIAYAGAYRGYGQIVIIDHGGGWTSLVTGLAALSVRVGDQVGQGDPLGSAGQGKSTVMVELRRNGRPVDIAPMVGAG